MESAPIARRRFRASGMTRRIGRLVSGRRRIPRLAKAVAHAVLSSAPMDFIEIARISDLPVGRAKSIRIGDRRIALYHTPKGFFASDETCPHRGGPLGE